jgi:hypothetical protein
MKAETTNIKAMPKQVKTTRGNIEVFNRGEYNYIKKS